VRDSQLIARAAVRRQGLSLHTVRQSSYFPVTSVFSGYALEAAAVTQVVSPADVGDSARLAEVGPLQLRARPPVLAWCSPSA
jgi:hypothetical protein